MFGFDMTSASATQTQQQVDASGGAAGSSSTGIGGVAGRGIGGGSSGNMQGNITTQKGGTTSIVSSDVFALQANTAQSVEALHDMTVGHLAALSANQSIAESAINFANLNANSALQTIQNMAGGSASHALTVTGTEDSGQTISGGGTIASASQEQSSMTGIAPWKVAAGVVAISLVFYLVAKHRI